MGVLYTLRTLESDAEVHMSAWVGTSKARRGEKSEGGQGARRSGERG